VCGVVSDQEMIAAKGPNIMGIEERCQLARACKWVDEVTAIRGGIKGGGLGMDLGGDYIEGDS
jgi:hypothetical protein